MFDLSISEIAVIAIVAVIFIGPKQLPQALATAGRWMARARGIMGNFRTGLDAMIREAELQEMEKKWASENERIMREHPMLTDGSVSDGSVRDGSAGDGTKQGDAAVNRATAVAEIPDEQYSMLPLTHPQMRDGGAQSSSGGNDETPSEPKADHDQAGNDPHGQNEPSDKKS